MYDATVRDMTRLISKTVEAKKSGRNLKSAISHTAQILGLSERRVRAGIYHEIRAVGADEWRHVKRRFARHVESEAQRRISEIEADFDELRKLEEEADGLEMFLSRARARLQGAGPVAQDSRRSKSGES